MAEKVSSQPAGRIKALQYVSFVLTKAYLVITKSQVTTHETWNVNLAHRYIIASSHVSWFDPFLATTALRWHRLRPLLPCRFMATPTFLRKPLLGQVMLWLGAFPSHPFKDYAFGLEASHMLLNAQHAVLIFPEGKRNRTDHKVHRGVAELANHPEALVIPVLIQIEGRFLGLRQYHVYTGEPFDGAGLSAEEIMTRVVSLCEPVLQPRMA